MNCILGYTLSELALAVNQTPSIPPLTADQLPQVIYHCENIYGNLTGNSFCVNNCLASLSLTHDDECQLAPGETCPPATSTVTVTVPPSAPTPTCFKKCQTWCFWGNILRDEHNSTSSSYTRVDWKTGRSVRDYD